MGDIKIIEWSADKFKASQDEWTELLNRSTSDPLFMSWEWQYTWWNIFSNPKNMELKLLSAVDRNGMLIGIAPLYLSVVEYRKFLKTRRLQFIGNCWRGETTMLTEFLDFITDRKKSTQIVRAFYRYIASLNNWDDFVLSNLDTDTETYRLLVNEKPFCNSYYRRAEEYSSYYLNMTGSFTGYLSERGKNTRLKLYNRRKLFAEFGGVKFDCEDIDVDKQFEMLNSLHCSRWGRPVFKGKRLDFNKSVANLMAKRSALQFSVLSVNNNPVSIQYNYILNRKKYNIQAGFDESFHKKISLGYLHFGYEIEDCFDNGLVVYDFLAGQGKNMQYKERLTDSCSKIVDMNVIRNKFARILYLTYDRKSKKKNNAM